MIKLIASDMDGTLLGKNQKISKENIEAIKLAQEKGIKFAIATGRAYEDVKPFLETYGLECECVVLNGGEYRDIAGKTVEGIYLDKGRLPEIFGILSKYDIAVEIYTDTGYYTTNSKEETIKGMMKRAKVFHPDLIDEDELYQHAIKHPHFVKMNYLKNLDAFCKSDIKVGKIVSFAESADEINRLEKELHTLDGLAVASSFATNIEINDIQATKGRILASAAEKMGIRKEEVAVLGDSSNDYSMFVEFPNSFAMENALPKIKKAAKYITASNVEHGVAKAIYRILDNLK